MLWGASKPVFSAWRNTNGRKGGYVGALSANRLTNLIREAAVTAGLQSQVTAKIIRHSFATHLYDAGVSINDLKELMGHQDRSETSIYVHISLDTMKQALNKHVAYRFCKETPNAG
jgi:site-specific recombinase XerD